MPQRPPMNTQMPQRPPMNTQMPQRPPMNTQMPQRPPMNMQPQLPTNWWAQGNQGGKAGKSGGKGGKGGTGKNGGKGKSKGKSKGKGGGGNDGELYKASFLEDPWAACAVQGAAPGQHRAIPRPPAGSMRNTAPPSGNPQPPSGNPRPPSGNPRPPSSNPHQSEPETTRMLDAEKSVCATDDFVAPVPAWAQQDAEPNPGPTGKVRSKLQMSSVTEGSSLNLSKPISLPSPTSGQDDSSKKRPATGFLGLKLPPPKNTKS